MIGARRDYEAVIGTRGNGKGLFPGSASNSSSFIAITVSPEGGTDFLDSCHSPGNSPEMR
jgi:hypothetical protein